MRLHLLRHAKTNQQSETGKDFDRKLLPKGHNQCKLLLQYFSNIKGINQIWCSSAARTRQTYKGISANLSAPVEFDKELYLCSHQVMLEKIWSNEQADDLLIIGHNFGISDLASYFTDEPIELRTGGYICIEFDAKTWQETSRGLGTIVDQYRPKASE